MAVDNTIEDLFYDHLLQNNQDELKGILGLPNSEDHCQLELYFVRLPTIIGEKILNMPLQTLSSLDRAAVRAQGFVHEWLENKTNMTIKKKVHVRLMAMPEDTPAYRTQFPESIDAGSFLALEGTIVRTTVPKLLEYVRFYRCSQCHLGTLIEADATLSYAFPSIPKCANECKGSKMVPYTPTEYVSNNVTHHALLKDYQEARLQESNASQHGTLPKAVITIFENDLVNQCKPGDLVIINGTLMLRWRPFQNNKPISAELVFSANHVSVKNDKKESVKISTEQESFFNNFWNQRPKDIDKLNGRNLILKSFAPSVFGLYLIKLAACIVIAGGTTKQTDEASTVRGESHLLLIGDPSTGKSRILKYITEIVPRAIFTTGAGVSIAGLTVGAMMEDGEWHLEAGALVLADGGICCIDEFGLIREHDRTSIHEAMEQQSISVAKAGIVCKLRSKCSVIAATNPKFNKYDPNKSMEVNTGLASPLLSRFDLIMPLRDTQNVDWDCFLTDYILNEEGQHTTGVREDVQTEDLWDSDRLQAYYALIKGRNTQFTNDAVKVISTYFERQRKNPNRETARSTMRLIESLYRLCEGHCKLMMSEEITVLDAVTVVILMEYSMENSALSPRSNIIHVNFPEDALSDYYKEAESVLVNLLGLTDVWKREKERLDRQSTQQPPPTNEFFDEDICSDIPDIEIG